MFRPAASGPSQHAIAELMSEIAFQKVLLSSIDDSVENREDAEHEVRSEIRSLEMQLRSLRGSTTNAASSSATPSPSQLLEPAPSNPLASSNPPNAAMDELLASESSGGYLAREIWHTLGPASSSSSTPPSPDSVPEFLTPSKMNLPNRKRSHSKHLDGGLAPVEGNKSRRTSPSPFMTGPTTPSSSSGDDEFESFDRQFFHQQKAEEERIQRERLDAEFALSLQNRYTSMNAAETSGPTRSGPSAFDRMSGMHLPPLASTQLGQPSSGRKLPGNTPNSSGNIAGIGIVKSEPPSVNSSMKSEQPYNSAFDTSFSSYTSTKNGKMADFKSNISSSKMPGAFPDDLSNASDSEIEIIPPGAFRDNGRHVPTPTSSRAGLGRQSGSMYVTPQPKVQPMGYLPRTQFTDEAVRRQLDHASTNDALQAAMYGNQNAPSRMDRTLPGSQSHDYASSMNFDGSYSTLSRGSSNSEARTVQLNGAHAGSYPYPSTFLGSFAAGDGGAENAPESMHGAYPGGRLRNQELGLGYALDNSPVNHMGTSFNLNQLGPSHYFPGINDDVKNFSPLSQIVRLTGHNDLESDFMGQPFDERMGLQLDYIMNDPRKTNEEIKALIENIRPDADLPMEDREGTPDGLKYPLYEHQKLALTWLKAMEEGTNKGGILADDMGLGKTISSLALILSRPSTDRSRKTTLIVGPVALVRQWEREIRSKINSSHKLSTHMVHGQGRKLGWDELRNFDIVLTTYGTLGAENKRLEVYLEKQKGGGNGHLLDQAPMRKLFPLLGPKSLFYRVILDEAQCIKNRNTNSAKAACQLKASTRFCLTGTPMMNNVGELYSLIHFLRIKPYNEYQRFQQAFGMLTKGDASRNNAQNAMRKLQAVLKAILLRRTKTSLIDGKPIINLPPKTEEIQHVVFSEEEQAFYNGLESKTRIQFNKYLRANTVGKNYSNILVLLLRLRQCCCHPHLITDFEEAPAAGTYLPVDAMMDLAKSLAPDVVGRLLAADGFECPVCYDGVENPSIVIPCGHDTCAECLSKISDQANQQSVAEGNEAGGALKCPTCRGKIDMNKIIDYASFKKVHKPDISAAVDETSRMDTDNEDSESEADSDSEADSETNDDEDENGDLRGFIVPDTSCDEIIGDDRKSVDGEDGDDEAAWGHKNKSKSYSKKKLAKKRRQKNKKGNKKATSHKHMSLAMLKKEASRSAEGRRRYMRYLRKNWQPSAKVSKCVELLERFQTEGQKTIVFSQFVSLLDLLQVPIDEKGWNCERYDGSMNADARNNAIVRFSENPNTMIMLISLKAGNAGLNLVAASRVIILDPFWNPFIEMQAVDRAYRIGQQRSVEVHRILIEKTVEDRIIELQEQKRTLVNSALDEGASKSLGRLTIQQLAFLFGVDGNSG